MPQTDKRLKMFDELMEGVAIMGNEVKLFVWIQNRRRSLD